MNIFSDAAVEILEKRYLLKDSAGKVTESPEGMLTRVAHAVAQAEREHEQDHWAERFFALMAGRRFLPNSPTLANAGRPKGQLSACFVLPVPDSIEGIFETMKRAALTHKSGGGTGFSFSGIRPQDDQVFSTGGIASGPLSFIKAFNCATEAIKQGGMRRGANMAVLDYWHPDILDFIEAKTEEGALANFNLSVGVDEKLITAVVEGGNVDLVNPRTGRPNGKTLSANKIMEAMVQNAWLAGEPGILFFDRINSGNTVPGLGPLRATNPCGEQPLFDYESCNLGSLNLPLYLNESDGGLAARMEWDKLAADIKVAVRFLDNVIDVNNYVFPEIEAMTKGNRKIGLGVMGFADLLVELGIPYGSIEALDVINELMGFIKKKAMSASVDLGKEKGSFPNIEKSIYRGSSIRNATVTTIAPTGTLSMLVDVSSGIEPLFGLHFFKEVLDGKQFTVTNRNFEMAAKAHGFWSQSLIDELGEKGSLREIKSIPENIRAIFATALEISPQWHVRVQAAFQRHVDNAVSKTVNFPAETKPADIRSTYLLAWQLGCKGLTIYRAGSRLNQVIKFAAKDRGPEENSAGCSTCMD